MSQNKGKDKKVHPVKRNNLAFKQYLHFFGEIYQKLRKSKKLFFFKATTFIKHKIRNLDY